MRHENKGGDQFRAGYAFLAVIFSNFGTIFMIFFATEHKMVLVSGAGV